MVVIFVTIIFHKSRVLVSNALAATPAGIYPPIIIKAAVATNSTALPSDIYAIIVTALEDIIDQIEISYEGMVELARWHGVEIIGGDTCQSPVLSITLL